MNIPAGYIRLASSVQRTQPVIDTPGRYFYMRTDSPYLYLLAGNGTFYSCSIIQITFVCPKAFNVRRHYGRGIRLE